MRGCCGSPPAPSRAGGRYWAASKRCHARVRGGDVLERAECAAPEPEPCDVAAVWEAWERIEAAVQRLSPEHRRLFDLVGRAGLSHREAGRRLGCSEDASRALWNRLRVRLARELVE